MNNYYHTLYKDAFNTRTPITCTIELTRECNFRCLHCYIPSNRQVFLSFDQVKRFVDSIVAKGCLFFTITGGDIFVHPDFERIYEYIFLKGCVITLFSNGSLLNKSHLALFQKYPPAGFEITLYGASEETYQKTVGVRLFERTINNIKLLVENNFTVLLKMFVMKENYDDFEAVVNISKDLGCSFKFDCMIIDDVCSSTISHQITPDQIIRLNSLAKSKINKEYDPEYEQFLLQMTLGKLFKCGAGRISCVLKANNEIRMCTFLEEYSFSLNDYSFDEVWNIYGKVVELPENKLDKCTICAFKDSCYQCPARSSSILKCIYPQPYPHFCEVSERLYKQSLNNND